jgi:poly-beta-1,6-N-acetyl-D-glucosamine synthase
MQSLFLVSMLTLFYIYVGYPILVGLAARVRGTRRIGKAAPGDSVPTLTLIVAAYNEEKVILEKIRNSLTLDYPRDRLEIVIATDGCTDDTNDIIRTFASAGVTLRATFPRRGKTRVLNDAIPHASGEIVVLSDANAMYSAGALRTLVRHFIDPAVGGVTGDVKIVNDSVAFGSSEGLYYRYERFLMEQESNLGALIGVDGAMYAIRKELFSPPSDNIVLDDLVISMNVARQGYRLVYDPEALAFEQATPEMSQEFKRKVRIVAGGFQALVQREGLPQVHQGRLWFAYVSHKLLRWLTPFALLVCLISAVALTSRRPLYGWFVAAQVAFYLAAAVGAHNRRFLASTLVNAAHYFCMVQAAAFLGFWKGILRRQSVMWKKAART